MSESPDQASSDNSPSDIDLELAKAGIVDGFLQQIVSLVNKDEVELFVLELIVGGTVIRGQLISAVGYWRGIANVYHEIGTEEGVGIAGHFNEIAANASKADHGPPINIHIKDVTVFAGGTAPFTRYEMKFLRLRLRDVSGYNICV